MLVVLVVVLLGLFALGAWAGAGWLVATIPPTQPLAEVGLYVFLFVAVSISAALIAWLATRPRSPRGELAPPTTYLGHAMLLSTILLFALWLQSLRMLTPVVAVLLAGLYALLELALLFGTRGAVDVEVHTQRSTSVESA